MRIEHIDIELAEKPDIPAIKRMIEQLYLELGEEKESIEFLDEQLISKLIKNGRTLILKAIFESQEIIGMLSLSESQAIYAGGHYGVIDEMYITPSYRSMNVGKKLIEKAKEIAIEKKWKRIDVTAPTSRNERTSKFYNNNGFIFTGPKMKFKINN